MKPLLKIAVPLVLLALVALLGISMLGSLVTSAVNEGGSYALGTETELESADVGLDGVGLGGLRIGNPPGFDSPDFMTLGNARLEVDLQSLTGDTVRAPLFSMDGLDLYLEKREGETNYGKILDHLAKFGGESDGGTGGEEDSGDAGPGKAFLIEKVRIQNVTAHLDLLPKGGEWSKIEVTVPTLELDNVGTAEGGATISQLFDQILQSVLASTLEVGAERIPGEMLQDLQGQLDSLGAQLTADLEDKIGSEAQKAIDQIEGGVQGLDQKLKGLLKK